jgi:parallel beta-helix repeat protein
VSCADADDDGRVPEGIVLVGKKARVRNGTVEGCDSGVEVAGSGKHTVQGIVARNIVDDVFDVAPESRKNRLVGNTASGGTDDGFEVRSDKNKLSDNVAEGNAEDGFDVIRASGNKLLRNRATGNGDSGYDIGGDRNKVTGNAASGNEGTGITVQGMRNRVVGNTSTGNLAADVYSSASCAVNVYRGNTFGTRSPDCIK